MNISIIVAIGSNHQIGLNGKLPWYSQEDLQYFKEKTMKHMVVMGRKTFEGLPKKLAGRTIIVLSRTLKNSDDTFIAGWESIYKQFIGMSDKIYLSKINYDGLADTYFPTIDETKWQKVEENKFRDGIWINYEKINDGGLF